MTSSGGSGNGSLRGLIDSGASCGTNNPLMRLTTHYTKDRAKQDEGILTRRPVFNLLKSKAKEDGKAKLIDIKHILILQVRLYS